MRGLSFLVTGEGGPRVGVWVCVSGQALMRCRCRWGLLLSGERGGFGTRRGGGGGGHDVTPTVVPVFNCSAPGDICPGLPSARLCLPASLLVCQADPAPHPDTPTPARTA